MQSKIDVLDHGFVRHVESWGRGDADCPEAGIIEAARQSTQGAFRGWDTDSRLLAFLFNNKPQHATPFEFAGMVIEVRAPIFVFREWHRHRAQSYNEMSARYAPLPALDYLPTVERCVSAGGHQTTNRQAQSINGVELTAVAAMAWLEGLSKLYSWAESHYQLGLSMGVPKEIARCSMVVARYSQMRAQATLRNWLAFLTLRQDPNAQWEIRQFANAVGQIIAQEFPQTWALFEQGRSA